ncbi:MAG: TIGR04086 family membrane protein [Lutisporaceae bacterium]
MKNNKNYFKKVYSSKSQDEDTKHSTYTVMLKSLAICFIMSFIMIIVYTLILSFSSMSDISMSKVTQAILILSVAISSIYGSKKLRQRGWMFGMVLGLLFALLLIPFGMVFGQSIAFDVYLIAKLLVSAVVGAIGGIIGVNLN